LLQPKKKRGLNTVELNRVEAATKRSFTGDFTASKIFKVHFWRFPKSREYPKSSSRHGWPFLVLNPWWRHITTGDFPWLQRSTQLPPPTPPSRDPRPARVAASAAPRCPHPHALAEKRRGRPRCGGRKPPGVQIRYPLVICYIAIENSPFIVDFPMKNGDFPVRYVSLPEGICPRSLFWGWTGMALCWFFGGEECWRVKNDVENQATEIGKFFEQVIDWQKCGDVTNQEMVRDVIVINQQMGIYRFKNVWGDV
jgi:hypothetical protein